VVHVSDAEDDAQGDGIVMAHGTTVAKVASDQGAETAICWADHIIETLEHNLRSERGTLYAIADLLLSDDPQSRFVAKEMAEIILETKKLRKENKDEWEPK
jgi:hypothetical protein